MDDSTIALWVFVAIMGLFTVLIVYLAFMTVYYRVKYQKDYTIFGTPIRWGHYYHGDHYNS